MSIQVLVIGFIAISTPALITTWLLLQSWNECDELQVQLQAERAALRESRDRLRDMTIQYDSLMQRHADYRKSVEEFAKRRLPGGK